MNSVILLSFPRNPRIMAQAKRVTAPTQPESFGQPAPLPMRAVFHCSLEVSTEFQSHSKCSSNVGPKA
jgi:hypothetical protein